MVLLAISIEGADQSCGCVTGLNDGVSTARDTINCILLETPAASGTADSMVFFARDFAPYGADTVYGFYADINADSSLNNIIGISGDSTEVTGASYVHHVVTFSGESVAASTQYQFCLTNRGSDATVRWEACNDAPGAGSTKGAWGVDAWPLEDPSSIPYDNTVYAPDLQFWYHTAAGADIVVRRRRGGR
jgi:hypothetical protein